MFSEKDDLDIAFRFSPEGISIADHEAMVLAVNPAVQKITGLPLAAMHHRKMPELVSKGIFSDSCIMKTLETEKRTSLSLRTSAGREFVAVAQPVFNRNRKIVRVVCNIRNVADIQEKNAKVKSIAGGGGKQIIAKSHAMQKVLELANRASCSDSNVLITGETGVGKGILARLIYENSVRTNRGSFVQVMCPAIPSTLFESELLGYEKGAFTGALTTGKKGLIETADRGVLFLDEIGELPTGLQAKLLSVIEEKSFLTLGGRIPKRVDVRIISATNRHIVQLMTSNLFREDLWKSVV